MEKRMVNLEIRSANIEERKIEGYAAIFNDEYQLISDRWGEKFYERVMPGAFTRTLKKRSDDIFMLINHDWNKVVGRSGSNLNLFEDEKGLRFELTVPNTTDGNDLLENVKNSLIRGCSFGFKIEDQVTRWDDDWNFYRDIKEVELFEVTATPIPAYGDTEISARSQNNDMNIKELREQEQGVEPKQEEPPQTEARNKQIIKSLFRGLVKEDK